MRMLRFALAPVFALCLAVPAFAQAIPLNELSRYLNSIDSAKSGFTQVNADGTTATGTVYIKRPGRVRFEYDKDKTLVMASAGQVAVFDPKSNQPATQYPLSRTPLSVILAPTVNLSQARMVVGHTTDGKTTTVVAQDPQHPEYGTISLVFAPNPTRLERWIISDDSGAKTVVMLNGLQNGVTLGPRLFSIESEITARK
ncbi:LolA family protein [Paenirhodobacter populi]|uniref:Outer membrane lipoprotein carrier protein LolA n=1 Tax=Paenirhodobacter populi TaxID=2306993 RepID=A0A443K3X3_9RHOB|nr:outer membrane lipoprotein carrier protein LolA [Sinirhodobacter populi]RWR06311.1 outer membrane lipoprotein carrier protein LolA [Sinirhodobacter populi]RWR27467.1 outer membrane lipoprotein carrier protein LolA [Sinirhodobacter populi]